MGRTSLRAALACAVAGALAGALACTAPQVLDGRPGKRIVAHLAPGETLRFAFALGAGEYAEIEVGQEALDAELTVSGRALGAPLAIDMLGHLPEPERVRLFAPAAARFTLDIRSGGSGAVAIGFAVRRPASPRDRRAARADERLARAEEIRRRGASSPDPTEDDRALAFYQEAIGDYTALGDAPRAAAGELLRARVLRRAGRAPEAAGALRRAISGDLETQARAAAELADLLTGEGAEAEADVWERAAADHWGRLQRDDKRAHLLNAWADRLEGRGELARAEALYEEALALYRKTGDRESVATVLANLASVYLLANEPVLALDRAQEARVELPPEADPETRANVLEQQGTALERLGRRDDAFAILGEAVALRRQAGDRAGISRAEGRLARALYESGRWGEAATVYRRALAAADSGPRRAGSSSMTKTALGLRQDLGWAELKRGRLDAAEWELAAVAPRAAAAGQPRIEVAARAGLAQVARARGQGDRALAEVRRALAGIEALRGEAGRGDLGTAVFALHNDLYDLAVDLLLERHAATGDAALKVEAFETSERGRARRLLDVVRAPEGERLTGATSSAASPEAAVERAERRLRVLEGAGVGAAEREGAERALRTAVLDLRRRTRGAALSGTPATLAEIRRQLPADAALLELDLGEERSVLWIVTGDLLDLRRLPPRAVVEAQVERAFAVLSASSPTAESPAARATLAATARLLLGATLAVPGLSARRWLVVPEGALHALPLGALPDPDSLGSHEQPILATREVAYAPSASVVVRLAERRDPAATFRRELAVVADAITSRHDPRLARATAAPGGVRGVLGALGSPGALDLFRLHFSGAEADAILALVPAARRLDLRGFGADKARVLDGALAGSRIVHFAVHGLPNREHPELGALALSLLDPRGAPRDGLLRTHEIARLDLRSELAVLSACRSGDGVAIAGEGLVGLAQAFFAAGARQVVATDWPVDDEATAALMRNFYVAVLRDGLAPPQALRRAQLALLSDPAWRRPYYWAGFAVQGGF